jgi:translation initiation factor 2 subunit 2
MTEVVRNATLFPTMIAHADAQGSSVEEFRLRQPAPHPTDPSQVTDTSLPSGSQEQPLPQRKQRKSVAFSGDNTVMDENGDISEAPPSGAEDRVTAEKHSSPSGDAAVDEVTDMFAGLNKKKKKSTKTKTEDAADGDAAAGGDADFDASTLKKKKKKSTKPKTENADDFAEKLARAGLADGGEEKDEDGAAAVSADQLDGDMEAGTGIWAHDATTPVPYALLLKRFFETVNKNNPDILMSGSKSYKIPPPQCLREGNKKTIFANIHEICNRMKRTDEHVTQFLFAELGTSGSVDGSKRLVIKGRFQQKQIENVLRRYIVEYVTCKTCRSPNTKLEKGENRLYFVECLNCGSRRSVTAIKSGFTAQVGKRKRLNG